MSEKPKKVLGGLRCSCGWGDACKNLLLAREADPNAVTIKGKKSLFIKVMRPDEIQQRRNKTSGLLKAQVFRRICALCNIDSSKAPKTIRIGIIHFHHDVIEAYNTAGAKGNFIDFLLPKELASKLPVLFTDIDKLDCIGTGEENESCKNKKKCNCKQYLNVPFVSQDNVSAVDWSSNRARRAAAYTESRETVSLPAEAKLQKERADRAVNEAATLRRLLAEARRKAEVAETTKKRAIESMHKEHQEKIQRVANDKKDALRKAKVAEQQAARWKKRAEAKVDASAVKIMSNMGISRISLLNPDFHNKYQKAARHLIGFESLSEFFVYAGVFFPDIMPDIDLLLGKGPSAIYSKRNFTKLEGCLIAKMAIRTGWNFSRLGYVFGVSSRRISQIISKWDPRWGWAGLLISHLDISADYLNKERPDEYVENDLADVGSQCDGKDYKCETFRKSSTLNRLVQSSKVKMSALRDITWSTPTGLVWMYSPLILARATESGIVQWMGSYSMPEDKHVPIQRSDWDGDCLALEDSDNDGDSDDDGDGSSVAIPASIAPIEINSDSEEEAEDRTLGISIAPLNDVDGLDNGGDGGEDFGDEGRQVWEEAMATGVVGYSDESGDEEADGPGDSSKKEPIPVVGEVRSFFDKMLGSNNRSGELPEKKIKLIDKTAVSAEELESAAAEVRDEGPDLNGKSKLEQLQILEELHLIFEGKVKGKKLRKCLLSMYLKLTKCDRRKMIKEIKDYRDGLTKCPPQIPRRLAKLPRELSVLADRGFADDSLSYPNFNAIVSPEFLEGREQFARDEVARDRKKCELRYTCEVVYSRVVNEDLLNGIVPFEAMARVSNAHSWAHGAANLRRPLKMPGSNSKLSEYFQ